MELHLRQREVKVAGRKYLLPVIVSSDQGKRFHLDLFDTGVSRHIGDGVRIEVNHRWYTKPSMRQEWHDRIEVYTISADGAVFLSRRDQERLGSVVVFYRVLGVSNWMEASSLDRDWRLRIKELRHRCIRREVMHRKKILPVERI